MLLLAVARVDDVLSAFDRPYGEAVTDGPPSWLGDSGRERWPALPLSARPAFLASRLLTRRLLAAATGLPMSRWQVSAQSNAAPLASLCDEGRRLGDADALAHVSLPCASLAHRLGWVAAAVIDGGDSVGVDLEFERPPRSEAGERAALMLADSELEEWRLLPEPARAPALLRSWVAKEAWFKASPAGDAAWDFRRVVARASAPARANVRVWRSAALHVGLCCGDADALARVACDGLPADQPADSSFWHVRGLD